MKAQRKLYWNHFIEQYFVFGVGGGYDVTGPRLRKIKSLIMADDEFWFDIIHRHGGEDKTPEEMAAAGRENYDHCLGNFWGMIYQTMVEEGVVKP